MDFETVKKLFKVGTKVRLKSNEMEFAGCVPGGVATIIKVMLNENTTGKQLIFNVDTGTGTCSPQCWVIVSVPPKRKLPEWF